MIFRKKYVITDAQIGLLFKEQKFQKILPVGTYEFWSWQTDYTVQSINITNTLVDGVSKEVLYLADLYPEQFAPYLQLWQTGEHQVGLVYQQGVLREIKA
ncbi:MAG TPA: hypothetical protein VIM59_19960, partial [Cellvibrio sp.]